MNTGERGGLTRDEVGDAAYDRATDFFAASRLPRRAREPIRDGFIDPQSLGLETICVRKREPDFAKSLDLGASP